MAFFVDRCTQNVMVPSPQNASVSRQTVTWFWIRSSGGEGQGEGGFGDALAPHPVPLPTRSSARFRVESARTYANGRGEGTRVTFDSRIATFMMHPSIVASYPYALPYITSNRPHRTGQRRSGKTS